MIELPEAKCVKCGHPWHPRDPSPDVCPNCANPNWYEGEKPTFDIVELVCESCGHDWIPKKPPKQCPKCKKLDIHPK